MIMIVEWVVHAIKLRDPLAVLHPSERLKARQAVDDLLADVSGKSESRERLRKYMRELWTDR